VSSSAVARDATEKFFRSRGKSAREPQVIRVSGAGPEVELRIYAPPGEGRKPAIYNIHGGGFVMGSASSIDGLNWQLAEEMGAVVVTVDYRLAPETPFPGSVEDCYVGFRWLLANAVSMDADPDRIVVMGDSAGGGLAAALTLWARDRNDLCPAALMLVYPALDHRTGSGSGPHPTATIGHIGWTADHNRFAWSALRGDYKLDDARVAYFSPALATDLQGLPPLFIAVGALDLFLEEEVDFALRASRAGVPVECHVYPGAIHGFDLIGDTSIGRQFRHDRREALCRWFRH
jgi:acetyl esterase